MALAVVAGRTTPAHGVVRPARRSARKIVTAGCISVGLAAAFAVTVAVASGLRVTASLVIGNW